MKNLATVIAALVISNSAFADTNKEAIACDIDPALIVEYSGYAGKQGVFYDRGDYFFTFTHEHFFNKISYKHWNKVEGITNHYRIYKDDCRMTNVETVHTESKPIIPVVPVEVPVPVVADVVEAPVETAQAPVEEALPTNYNPYASGVIDSLNQGLTYGLDAHQLALDAASSIANAYVNVFSSVSSADRNTIRNSLTIRTENTNSNSAERLRRQARGFIVTNIPQQAYITNTLSDMNDRHFEFSSFVAGRF